MEQIVTNNITDERPLLSICIPIYNRLSFLQMMLERFMEDKELFEKEIELIISDNCSKEDLYSCVDSFKKRGLSINYHRQECNLGPDGNFNYCFHHANGKYMWLLGSDDIPLSGIIQDLVNHLRGKRIGLLHFNKSRYGKIIYKEYSDNNRILVDINVQITFMSANIISTDRLRQLDLLKYAGTNLIQVPAFMDACLSNSINAVYKIPEIFEPIADDEHTGDYDLFGVMVRNLFTICQEFVDDGRLRKEEFENFKKAECEWVSFMIIVFIFLRKKNNYVLNGAWKNLFHYYGKKPYFYLSFFSTFFKLLYRQTRKILQKSRSI